MIAIMGKVLSFCVIMNGNTCNWKTILFTSRYCAENNGKCAVEQRTRTRVDLQFLSNAFKNLKRKQFTGTW